MKSIPSPPKHSFFSGQLGIISSGVKQDLGHKIPNENERMSNSATAAKSSR